MKATVADVLARLTAVVLAVAALHAAAESASTADRLKGMVEARQYAQAYALGNAAQLELEGTESFDFYYGLAALESGHYYEATFALERAAIARPDQSRIRLELARGFFLANDFEAARAQFATVLAENPPPEVQANIKAYLKRMDDVESGGGGQHLQFFVEAVSGHDDNVNSSTSAGTITTPTFTFDLPRNGQALKDAFLSVGTGVALTHPFSKTAAGDISATASFRANQSEQQFNLGTFRVESGYGQTYDHDRWRLGVRAQVVTLDKDRFQNAYGVIGSWTHDLGDGWLASLSGAATTQRFNGDSLRDTDQYLGAATVSREFGRFAHSLTVYGADEPARDGDTVKSDGSAGGAHNGNTFYGAAYGVQMTLTPEWSPFAGLMLQKKRYDERQPVFGIKRDDDQYAVRLGVLWTLMLRLMVRAEYRYTNVDSNIDIYKYDRSEVEAGLRYIF